MSLKALAFFQFLLASFFGLATTSALIMGIVGTGFSLALVLFGVAGIACAMCMLVVSDSLQLRQNHSFCIAIAACECFIFPMGTVLVLFTIQTLRDPKIKRQFGTTISAANHDGGSPGTTP
ncbi:hypothetical protein FHS27_006588 [Rhodopirellula rubra]|uniref:Uncharacterized protein n=1 Tax=Aporhodopirellula rubra TaxID=980271 RepID=A0A7W5E5T1_9BACT|nr:hypothetical protein [Aporhodopirellula rubra]MBB3210740.1 hypothetical protein [Aporhodopirellula rubra]